MREITLDNLEKFQNIFEFANSIKHVVIILTIKSFIQRFKSFPELKQKAKLFVFSEFWEIHEIFFMTER